jgi:hypothetical protein
VNIRRSVHLSQVEGIALTQFHSSLPTQYQAPQRIDRDQRRRPTSDLSNKREKNEEAEAV